MHARPSFGASSPAYGSRHRPTGVFSVVTDRLEQPCATLSCPLQVATSCLTEKFMVPFHLGCGPEVMQVRDPNRVTHQTGHGEGISSGEPPQAVLQRLAKTRYGQGERGP